jgi:hypothetical protein
MIPTVIPTAVSAPDRVALPIGSEGDGSLTLDLFGNLIFGASPCIVVGSPTDGA